MGLIKDTASSISQFSKNAYASWRNRERKPKEIDPPNVTVFAWQVRAAHTLSWGAWAIAAYFFWSYCTQTAGDQSSALHLTHVGGWVGDVLFYFPLIIGFGGLSLAVPYLAKSIIPIFVAFSWRHHFWPKLASLILIVAASFALIASSFSVMGGAIIEHGRGAAVAVEQVQNERAALQAQIDAEDTALRDMSNNRNAYMAQAANVGAAAWQSGYIDQARRTHDDRLPMIERALGAAQAADARRAHIVALRTQLAQSATIASVEANPATADTARIADAMSALRLAWPIIMSVLNDIVCLFLGWIAYHLEKIRTMQLGMHQEAHESRWPMVEDQSDQPPIVPQQPVPLKKKQRVYNAETGQEEVFVQPKGHWRATGKKKKNADGTVGEVREFVPEVGVIDAPAPTGTGDERGASEQNAHPGPMQRPPEEYSPDKAEQNTQPQSVGENQLIDDNPGSHLVHSEPPAAEAAQEPNTELTDEERAYLESQEAALSSPTETTEEATAAQEREAEAEARDESANDGDHGVSDEVGAEHEPILSESTALTPPGYFNQETAERRRRAYTEELKTLEGAK